MSVTCDSPVLVSDRISRRPLTTHAALDGQRHKTLDFLWRQGRNSRVDLHLHACDVGNDIDLQIHERPDSKTSDQQSDDHHRGWSDRLSIPESAASSGHAVEAAAAIERPKLKHRFHSLTSRVEQSRQRVQILALHLDVSCDRDRSLAITIGGGGSCGRKFLGGPGWPARKGSTLRLVVGCLFVNLPRDPSVAASRAASPWD
jgi:hypothetical protein